MHKSDFQKEFVEVVKDVLSENVEKYISLFGRCTIALTGGRAAKLLYQSIAETSPFDLGRMDIFFGDERLVAPNDEDSNYYMAINALCPNGIPKGCVVNPIDGTSNNCVDEASRYSSVLPESMDIVLLSVGEDGHIASLFPHDLVVSEYHKKARPVVAKKQPSHRITITPKILKSAKTIIVMALGAEKGRVLAQALEAPKQVSELPVTLTIGSTWVLDKSAAKIFAEANQNKLYETRILYA